jgi:hypothetical protein
MQLRGGKADSKKAQQTIPQGARIVLDISSQELRHEGTMHYDIHRHDSRDYLSSDATRMACDILAEREGLPRDRAASQSDQRESRHVMEELLRECLKRRPLS